MRKFFVWLAPACYGLLIVFGSLYPLRDLRFPDEGLLEFMFAPLTPRFSRADLVTNIVLYLPLGFMLERALRQGGSRLRAAAVALAAGAALSLGLEATQTAIPGRIASNLDFIGNAAGTLLGILVALLADAERWPGTALSRFRRSWLRDGRLGDVGLVLAGLWLLAQFSLEAPGALGGNLTRGFTPFWEGWRHSESLRAGDALLYGLDIAGAVLFALSQLRAGRRTLAALATLVLLSLAAKALAAAALVKPAVLERLLSIESVSGLGIAAALLGYLPASGGLRRPEIPAVAVLLCLAATHALLVALAPEAEIARVAHRGIFPNITTFAFALSLAWPLMAALQVALLRLLGPGDSGR